MLARHDFPAPAQLKTIQDLGGWDRVDTDLFDPVEGSIAKQIESDNPIGAAAVSVVLLGLSLVVLVGFRSIARWGARHDGG